MGVINIWNLEEIRKGDTTQTLLGTVVLEFKKDNIFLWTETDQQNDVGIDAGT
ncbi:MAG: hypothetical protein IIA45_12810 [Bacteroidetes bacterium]|nr:hypothetical protein [Bacteroidota bacterium]